MHAQNLGEANRRVSEQKSESDRRRDLFKAASHGLSRLGDAIRETIVDNAPMARVEPDIGVGWSIQLGQATLTLNRPAEAPPNPWSSGPRPPFDVIAYSALSVQMPPNHNGFEGRGHSLWYCDAHEANKYQWFETAFMTGIWMARTDRQDPYPLDPGGKSGKAFAPGLSMELQVEWPFTALDIGDLDEFIERWAGWLAKASQGQLSQPNIRPERDARGSWRQS
jgi:eukaryotic-like serine/threonine-protein kinase